MIKFPLELLLRYSVFFFTKNAHLIEQNIFNSKVQVVYLVLKHRDSKQRKLHKHFTRLFSTGVASKCIIRMGRRMFDTPFNCVLQINAWHNPLDLAIITYFRSVT